MDPNSINIISFHQRITVFITAIVFLCIIVDLVRIRRLKEEFAWLWLSTATFVVIFTIRIQWLIALAKFVGAGTMASGAYFLGILFLSIVSINLSIKISRLTEQTKKLAQKSALLENKIERSARETHG